MRLFNRRKAETTLYVVYMRPCEITDFREYSKLFVRARNEEEAMEQFMDNKIYKAVAIVPIGKSK